MKKNLFLAAIAMTAFSCSDNSEQINDSSAESTNSEWARAAVDPAENMEDFVKNKAIVLAPRVATKLDDVKTAKSFGLISYSDITARTYIVNGDDYNDLGQGNDEEANDGIYTSEGLYEPESGVFNGDEVQIRFSADFAFQEQLQHDIDNGTIANKFQRKLKN